MLRSARLPFGLLTLTAVTILATGCSLPVSPTTADGGGIADPPGPALAGYDPDPTCGSVVAELSEELDSEYGQHAVETDPSQLPFALPDDLLGEVACTYAQFVSEAAPEPAAIAMLVYNPDNYVPSYLGTSPDLTPRECEATPNATCYLDTAGNLVIAGPVPLTVNGVEVFPGTAQVVVHLIG